MASKLECVICSEGYKDPVCLPCGHSFCLGCIECWAAKGSRSHEDEDVHRLLRSRHIHPPLKKPADVNQPSKSSGPATDATKLSCPECREKHDIPQGGVKDFPRNYALLRSSDNQQACDTCDEKRPAVVWCKECCEWFCSPCRDQHKKFKMSRNHSLLCAADGESGVVMVGNGLRELKPCSKHSGKPMDIYCVECQELCCVSGSVTTHKPHQCVSLEEKMAEIRVKFEEAYEDLDGEKQDIDKIMSVWDESKGEREICDKAIKCLLEDKKKAITSSIEDHFQQLFERVDAYSGQFADTYKQVTEMAQSKLNVMQRIHEESDKFLDESSPHEVCGVYQEKLQRIVSIAKSQLLLPNLVSSSLESTICLLSIKAQVARISDNLVTEVNDLWKPSFIKDLNDRTKAYKSQNQNNSPNTDSDGASRFGENTVEKTAVMEQPTTATDHKVKNDQLTVKRDKQRGKKRPGERRDTDGGKRSGSQTENHSDGASRFGENTVEKTAVMEQPTTATDHKVKNDQLTVKRDKQRGKKRPGERRDTDGGKRRNGSQTENRSDGASRFVENTAEKTAVMGQQTTAVDHKVKSEPRRKKRPGERRETGSQTENPLYDEGRAKATFKYTVENISKLHKKQQGSQVMIRNLPWNIFVMPNYENCQGQRTKYLGFFLKCNLGSVSCNAQAELRILSQIPDLVPFTRKIQHIFCSKEKEWGYRLFLTWTDLMDPERGYVKDDCVTFQVHVLADAPKGEREVEAQIKKKRRTETHAYLTVRTLTEQDFHGNHGQGLFEEGSAVYNTLHVKKKATLSELMKMMSKSMKYPVCQMRPWPFYFRPNQTFRPTSVCMESDINKTVEELANGDPWTIFVETEDVGKLPQYCPSGDVLLFFKCYDPKRGSLSYSGHKYMPITDALSTILPFLCEKSGFAPGTDLLLFEEVSSNQVEHIKNIDRPLEKVVDELLDGDIIIYQKYEPYLMDTYDLPTSMDYFRHLNTRIEVLFCDKSLSEKASFTLKLSKCMNYNQVANAVAKHMNVSSNYLQFFKASGHPVESAFEGTLQDLLVSVATEQPRKLYMYYQRLTISIRELEIKRKFKCHWVNHKLEQEKELVLFIHPNGTVADLLKEARKEVKLAPSGGSARLRLLEVIACKIVNVHSDDTMLRRLTSTKTYRIEEIPVDEVDLLGLELLVPVSHFNKEIFSTFGVPFLLKIEEGEPFNKVRERIQRKLNMPDKEFQEIKIAIVMMGRLTHLSGNPDYQVNLEEFTPRRMRGGQVEAKAWLGLNHINKTSLSLQSKP